MPKNSLFDPPQHRTDLRFQQRVPLPGGVSIDGIAEVFNVFNRENFEIQTAESAADFKQNIAGQFRSAQFEGSV